MANEKAGSTVNEQITDAVTQSKRKVVAESPAMALSNVYQTAAHSTGICFKCSEFTEPTEHCDSAATTQGISQIYSLDTIADAVSMAKILIRNSFLLKAEYHYPNNRKIRCF